MGKIVSFVKREIVLTAAVLLAVISCFFVPPDKEYLGYIDFRTLAVLFSLMVSAAGMKELGVFSFLADKLLSKAGSMRVLAVISVLMCFFFSMIITNDVALVTFIPFTFILLSSAGEKAEKDWLIPLTVMQTIAANLGSMLTPIGNPQNLYLFALSDCSVGEFVLVMLPYTLVSLILLIAWAIIKPAEKGAGIEINSSKRLFENGGKKRFVMYLLLFAVSLLSVFRVVHFGISAALCFVCALIADRRALKQVDYSLLLSFAGFFVFIGNMGRIPAFKELLESIISGREVITSIAASQIISNVPAAILLSEFTDNVRALIIGTNLGGLGTLIASMASLISYKRLAKEKPSLRGRYLVYFTLANIAFLAILILLSLILGDI